MFRGEPIRVEVPGYTPRVVATAEQIFVCVIDAIERTAHELHRPRRLHALDWRGRPSWSCALPDGEGVPCIDDDGVLWVAETHALLGIDARGTTVSRVAPSLPENERIGAFLPLADGFLLAIEAPGGRRGPRGRVIRIDRAGTERWARELMPGELELDGIETRGGGEEVRKKSGWRASSWNCVHHMPLAVSGTTVLCGFHEWPRTGVGRRYVLDLDRGGILWSSAIKPWGYAAIAGSGVFLIGQQGYGAFTTDLVGASGVIHSWPTHGHYLVTADMIRVVEMENVSTAVLHTAKLLDGGTVARGERLPGYYTGGPVALADGSIFMWRGGALLRVDASGTIVRRQRFGEERAAAGRIVTDGRGRFACVVSDEEYGRGDWPLWILETDLPGLATGPWPCDGRSPRNLPVRRGGGERS